MARLQNAVLNPNISHELERHFGKYNLGFGHIYVSPPSILEESPQTLEGIDWRAGWAIVGSYLQISRIFEHSLPNLWGWKIREKSKCSEVEEVWPKSVKYTELSEPLNSCVI